MKKLLSSVLLIIVASTAGIPTVYADEGFFSWLTSFERKKGIAPVTNETYNEECGSCHFAYQPGLLPAGSWKKLLNAKALEDHFGENAELDEETRLELINILLKNSADKSTYKRSKKIMVSLNDAKNKTPLRITETPYIKQAHHEIPDKIIKSENIKSLSFCNKCHQEAKDGIFDDDTVMIPGHGYWTW